MVEPTSTDGSPLRFSGSMSNRSLQITQECSYCHKYGHLYRKWLKRKHDLRNRNHDQGHLPSTYHGKNRYCSKSYRHNKIDIADASKYEGHHLFCTLTLFLYLEHRSKRNNLIIQIQSIW